MQLLLDLLDHLRTSKGWILPEKGPSTKTSPQIARNIFRFVFIQSMAHSAGQFPAVSIFDIQCDLNILCKELWVTETVHVKCTLHTSEMNSSFRRMLSKSRALSVVGIFHLDQQLDDPAGCPAEWFCIGSFYCDVPRCWRQQSPRQVLRGYQPQTRHSHVLRRLFGAHVLRNVTGHG